MKIKITETLVQVSGLLLIGLGLASLQDLVEKRFRPRKKLRDVSGMRNEDILDEEPPGLEYDHRDPCHLSGIEGASMEGDVGYCVLPKDFEPAESAAPFAEGDEDPLWPIQTDNSKKVKVSYRDVRGKWHGKWGRHFGTSRKGKTGIRRHSGIDLKAHGGDVVQAMEDGEVLAILPFTAGTWGVYVLHDSGHIVNYGEVSKSSWKEFAIESGIGTGQRVVKGQPLARVGVMGQDTSMLHLETLTKNTTAQEIRDGVLQWLKDAAAPEQLLDPSQYLVRAQRGWFERKSDEEPEGPLEA